MIAEGEEIRALLIYAFSLFANADFKEGMGKVTAATDRMPRLSAEAFRLSLMRGLDDRLVKAVQNYVEAVRTACGDLNGACPNDEDLETDSMRAAEAANFQQAGYEKSIWAIKGTQDKMASVASVLVGTKDSH